MGAEDIGRMIKYIFGTIYKYKHSDITVQCTNTNQKYMAYFTFVV